MYRAVIRNCSLPIEGYRVRVARVQHPRVERAVVGGDCVRLVAVVGPSYRASRFNGHIRRVEEVVPYLNRACILHGNCLHPPSCAKAAGANTTRAKTNNATKSSRRFISFLLSKLELSSFSLSNKQTRGEH